VHVFVEIPLGSQNKYEFDKELGIIKLDRALYSAVYYPTDYGCVPRTKSEDGELLDAMILAERPSFPGCLVAVRLVGVLTIEHTSGLPERKLLSVPTGEPRLAGYRDIDDVPEHQLKEIEHFFDVFKDLEGSDVGTRGWAGAHEANSVLDAGIERYK
jgi:inorganic pyrophosphatase